MRTIYRLNGKKIELNAQHTIDGVTYPNIRDNWASLGVEEVQVEDYPDQQLYTWTENLDGTLNITQKTQAELLEQAKKAFLATVQVHLDENAQAHGYDGIVSACSYAAAPNVFQAESIKFLSWRADVWAYCYAELGKVEAGARPIPELQAFISELPALVL